MSASQGPWGESGKLCLPPRREGQLLLSPELADVAGPGDLIFSEHELLTLVRWFKIWHPDTYELALREQISPQRQQRQSVAGRCPLCEASLNRDGSCAASCAGVGDG